MRRYGHADANQRVIVATLRQLGFGVANLTILGGGVPDLLVCDRQGHLTLLEVKNPAGKNVIEHSQRSWAERWPGAVQVVRTVDEALQALGVEVMA